MGGKTMEELKTLKDMEIWNGCEGHVNELKQEAIKWIKQDIEDYRIADLNLPKPPVGTNIHNFIVSQRQKWKDRFNITDEDLK